MSAQGVVVVGGGIAGLCAAYFLRREGLEVQVLEANRLGSGASSGNGGWVCPAQAGPLPEPGLISFGIRSIFSRDSPLYIAPAQLPAMAGWLLRFAWHCNRRDHRRGTEALALLGRRTFALHEQFEQAGVRFETQRRGMLAVAERRETAERFLHGLAPLRDLGYQIPAMAIDGEAVREREPLLSRAAVAGIPIVEHIQVDPMSLLSGLAAHLRDMGVSIEEGRAVAVLPKADAVVLAAGAWTAPILRRAGAWAPIAAGKGYSFELPAAGGDGGLRQALLLLDAHLGVSPFAKRTRVVGTMEFSGLNTRLDARRVGSIARVLSRLLPGLEVERRENVWTGMRPIAPDGLPVIDRVPGLENVYVASAYSMLGMTLAAPAGEALAEMVLGGRRPHVLEPFRIDRFRRLGRFARW